MSTVPQSEATTPAPVPTIHPAERASGTSGAVLYGEEIGFAAAIARRKAGEDIIVRGDGQSQGKEEAMRFFTRELYERGQSGDDAVLDAAEDEWELANERYEQHLQAIEAALPAHIRS